MKRFFSLLMVLFSSISATAQEDWQADAAVRIEQHRKENVTVTVLQNGEPVAGAKVEMTMTRNEFLFGSNIFKLFTNKTAAENEAYQKRFAELLNFATLPFYWAYYEPKKDQPKYASSEKIIAWCKEHDIRTKGHPLVWNTADPAWIKDYTQDELYQRVINRAATVAERFRGTIEVWDVINEVVGWKYKQDRSPILTQLGLDRGLVPLARDSFIAVRKASPDAVLILNENTPNTGFVELLRQMNDADGKPLYDVIGIQSHMHGGTWSNEKIWEVCERFTPFKVPLHFTELTVTSAAEDHKYEWWNEQKDVVPSTPEGEAKQCAEVVRIYTMLFSHPSVEAITWWDFGDQGSWMRAPSGLLRADMSPKPAYNALKKLMKEEWATNTTLQTNDSGIAEIRAFRGEYRFTITLPDGTKHSVLGAVKKGDNELRIEL